MTPSRTQPLSCLRHQRNPRPDRTVPTALPTLSHDQVVRLWFHRQGFSVPRGAGRLTPESLRLHLERTGALQLDSINVVDRAHYLTLWSRFGPYDRTALDRWMYDDQVAYEYWGHEASLLPISHLSIGRRRMRRFPPKVGRASRGGSTSGPRPRRSAGCSSASQRKGRSRASTSSVGRARPSMAAPCHSPRRTSDLGFPPKHRKPL